MDRDANVAIVDYGMGNLCSVQNALRAVGAEPYVCDTPDGLQIASAIVLPGVGGFGAAMERLREHGWIGALERAVMDAAKPFLGICLGMQILASEGAEHGRHSGLGWIRGTVERLPERPGVRLPHIAWNDVTFRDPGRGMGAGLQAEETFYFVHSYAFVPETDDDAIVKATSAHGTEFVAGVEQGNIWATQFHPEKSQRAGLRILRNFVEQAG